MLTAVTGINWGDEGKGRVIDLDHLSSEMDAMEARGVQVEPGYLRLPKLGRAAHRGLGVRGISGRAAGPPHPVHLHRCPAGKVCAERSMVVRHFIEPGSFTLTEQLALLDLADRMEKDPAPYAHLCDGRILATLFYEPSTRTRLSFESAMLRLGGKTLGFAGAQLSSASKGETVADTARVVGNYADIIAMRHPKEGAPLRASMCARVPVINAGDGGHAHPSQTMIDLMTIRQRKGRLDHLTIGFCGDLKFGRTVHSLTAALSQFEGNRFVFISLEELRLPQYVKDETLTPLHQNYTETADLEAELPGLDVLYMTRIQQERFFNEEDYLRLKGCYQLDEKMLEQAPSSMPVLHPLPRIDEIAPDVDNDPRAAYFDQVHNGVYIRMAIILALLGIPDPLTGKKVLQD